MEYTAAKIRTRKISGGELSFQHVAIHTRPKTTKPSGAVSQVLHWYGPARRLTVIQVEASDNGKRRVEPQAAEDNSKKVAEDGSQYDGSSQGFGRVVEVWRHPWRRGIRADDACG